VKDLYLPDNAAALVAEGYVVLAFDYKGWGESEGPKSHLNPHGRVADAQAALTFLALRPEVDADRLGVYGTSYGGATVVWLAAVDERVKCMVSVVGIGHGKRWMRSVRRPDEWFDLLEQSATDRARRLRTGESTNVDRNAVLLPDRQSLELATAARRDNPAAISTLPFDYVDETLVFNPEWVVDKIAPRAALFITSDQDRLVPPEESIALYERAGEPKKLVILKGYGHYEVYSEPAFSEVMRETIAWYQRYVPAR
jgi:dipeptidyl aminopeptidase/acylaminoacyl peptidase